MNTLEMLLVAWGAVTIVLLCIWIYRSTLENREEDQIFLAEAGQSMANEQRALVVKIEKLSRPIAGLALTSGTLLVVIAGYWLWQGFQSF